MTRSTVCDLIRRVGIIPAIRVSTLDDAHFAADAIAGAGIPIVEITMTVPGAIDLIADLVRNDSNTAVGAGTVLDIKTAQRCIDAGAAFLTAPEFHPPIIEYAAKANVAVLPGALTPTEIVAAWRSGADFVKVFPCAQVGGSKYIQAVHTSLPQIPLVAAGGVDQQTAASFILCGATAIGIGKELIPSQAILHRQTERIRELASRFSGYVIEARQRVDENRRQSIR